MLLAIVGSVRAYKYCKKGKNIMTKNKGIFLIALFLFLIGIPAVATASLTVIGTASYAGSNYNLIHDDGMNVTWLDYSNAGADWQSQVDWAASLNDAGVITLNLNSGVEMNLSGEWRLPTTVDGPWQYGVDGTTTGGYNITTSEMGHLYYEELDNASVGGLENMGDFANLVEGLYWSETAYTAGTNQAWTFKTATGLQGRNCTSSEYLGIAVIDSSPVPVPAAVWLLGSGLLGLIGIRRRA
jgi:hypothetical protein